GDGRAIAAADARSVRLYRITEAGTSALGRIDQTAEIVALGFSGDKDRLAVASAGLVITVWELRGDRGGRRSVMNEQKKGKNQVLRQVQFSEDGSHLAVGMFVNDEDDDDNSWYPVGVWEVDSAKRILESNAPHFALNERGSQIATAYSNHLEVDNVAKEENTRVGRVVQDEAVTQVRCVGDVLLSAGRDKTVRAFELYARDINEVVRIDHDEPVAMVQGRANADVVTTLSGGKTVHQWMLDQKSKGMRLYEGLRISAKDEIVGLEVCGRWI